MLSMSTLTETKSAKRPYHHGDLPAALLRVCRDQLEKGGIDAVSLRAAARQLGVSHAAPIKHFPTKTALLTAIAAQGYREALDVLSSALTTGTTATARIRALCQAFFDFGRHHPNLYQLMSMADLIHLDDPALEAPRRACFQRMKDSVRDLAPLRDDEAEERTILLWSFLHGYVLLSQNGVFSTERPFADGKPGPLTHLLAAIGSSP